MRAAETLAETGSWKSRALFALGSFLDVVDGSIARRQKTDQVRGAWVDVATDRVGDFFLARLIASNRAEYKIKRNTALNYLEEASQLSALTKAIAEMVGAQTEEGGPGGMVERRKGFFSILRNFGKLNNDDYSNELLTEIDNSINTLVKDSVAAATERTEIISESLKGKSIMDAIDDLHGPMIEKNSSAHVEAGKYVAIVLLNDRMGIDIVGALNELMSEVGFPAVEAIIERFEYTQDHIKDIDNFLDKVLHIAGFIPEVTELS